MKADLMNREGAAPSVSVQELLNHVLEMDASDLHLTAGAAPTIRVHGDLKPVDGYNIMEPEELRRMVYAVLTQAQRERLEQELELDLSYSLPGKARFRVNVYFQRDAIGAASVSSPFPSANLTSWDCLGRSATSPGYPEAWSWSPVPPGRESRRRWRPCWTS
jgi:hypothetical protein